MVISPEVRAQVLREAAAAIRDAIPPRREIGGSVRPRIRHGSVAIDLDWDRIFRRVAAKHDLETKDGLDKFHAALGSAVIDAASDEAEDEAERVADNAIDDWISDSKEAMGESPFDPAEMLLKLARREEGRAAHLAAARSAG